MNKEYSMIRLYDEFLRWNKADKRILTGGKKLSKGSKRNYEYLKKHLLEFSRRYNFPLRIRQVTSNKRVISSERKYYDKLYKGFTEYLYKDCGHFDNYIGANIKMIKTFLKWVQVDKGVFFGDFYKKFHVWKEEIPIVVLSVDQLRFLIQDQEFSESLKRRHGETKDIFILGCTVGLRVSDIFNLKKSNIEVSDESTYIKKISKKTGKFTKVKLPDYAIAILKRQRFSRTYIFQRVALATFNHRLKQLIETAGWTYKVPKFRRRRGKPVEIFKDPNKRTSYRFCDQISSHAMRRTSITSLLNLGMDEHYVRRISGHAPGSKEFYRYVKYNQDILDKESELAYAKLNNKMPIF